MPKVSEAYFENKINFILDSALKVCKIKPAYDLTMKDVVKQSGLSQGGVYKYFANIDEVFVAIINRENPDDNFNMTIDGIMEIHCSPEQKIVKLFDFSAKNISEGLTEYGKFYFETSTLWINYPERYNKIKHKINEASNLVYLTNTMFSFIKEQVKKGYFKPLHPIEEVFTFIIVSYDGIFRDLVLSKCYGSEGTEEYSFDEYKLINVLCKCTISILGGRMDVGL